MERPLPGRARRWRSRSPGSADPDQRALGAIAEAVRRAREKVDRPATESAPSSTEVGDPVAGDVREVRPVTAPAVPATGTTRLLASSRQVEEARPPLQAPAPSGRFVGTIGDPPVPDPAGPGDAGGAPGRVVAPEPYATGAGRLSERWPFIASRPSKKVVGSAAVVVAVALAVALVIAFSVGGTGPGARPAHRSAARAGSRTAGGPSPGGRSGVATTPATTGAPATTVPPASTATTVPPATTATTAPPPAGPAPQITSISPSAGGPGQSVVVSGSGLFSSDGHVTAFIGGTSAPTACPSQASCTVTVPDLGASAGPVPLTITTAGGTSNAVPFGYG
ncbi:MAG: IPT/TIG domain-containing protein [Acidimicrobiales bacterium]